MYFIVKLEASWWPKISQLRWPACGWQILDVTRMLSLHSHSLFNHDYSFELSTRTDIGSFVRFYHLSPVLARVSFDKEC